MRVPGHLPCWFRLLIVPFLIVVLTASPGAAQDVVPDRRLETVQARTLLVPVELSGRGQPAASSGPSDLHYTLPVDSAQDLGPRYQLIGMVAGGLLGLAAYEIWTPDEDSCNPGDIDYCPYMRVGYVLTGAGFGGMIGRVVGMFRTPAKP